GHSRCRGRREAGNDETACGCRVNSNACLRAGNAGVERIDDGERLAAGDLEGGAKSVLPCVQGRESIVSRQDRLAVAAREVDRACVTGRYVAVAVFGGDGEGTGYTSGRGWKAGHDEFSCSRRDVAPHK